jgi:uncharacterized membrane protein
MQNLKNLLMRPLRPVPVSLVVVILVVAILGFADASYLAVEHYLGIVPPCVLTAGCDRVLTSSYSTFFGIPVALFGALFYFLAAAGAFAYLEGKHEQIFRYSQAFMVAGLGASIWFVYLQVFVLHSYCLYCMGSALTSAVLFILACVVFAKYGTLSISERGGMGGDRISNGNTMNNSRTNNDSVTNGINLKSSRMNSTNLKS